MAYIHINENFLVDAITGIKNRVQKNIGNMANGFRSVTNYAKNFAGGIADKINNAQNTVSNFAQNVVGSKNVNYNNNPQNVNQQYKEQTPTHF